jgi:hypothetical protein
MILSELQKFDPQPELIYLLSVIQQRSISKVITMGA